MKRSLENQRQPSSGAPLKVGVFGGSGYVGLELMRLLLNHVQADLALVTSREYAGKSVASVHPSLEGLCPLIFVEPPALGSPIEVLDSAFAELDLLFFAVPHAQSSPVIGAISKCERFVSGDLRIIDLGADFRLSAEHFSQFYKQQHPCPELIAEAVYGTPEVSRDGIKSARLVANPGCFANCVTLGLLPLVLHFGKHPLVARVSAVTGSTGSGVTATAKTHHPARNESMSSYEVLTHRHGPEIEQALSLAQSGATKIHLVPHSGNFSRGIYSTSFVTIPDGSVDVVELYRKFCATEFFMRYRDVTPRVLDVRGSNFCDITVRQQGSEVVVISTLDNLVKGAAGNAIQNMNLMYHIPETTGLCAAALFP